MTLALSLTAVANPSAGWYRGDFHAHTNFSDGVLTPPQLVEAAKSEGLDFLAITDHNAIGAYPHFGEHPGFLVLPGIEVTLTDGHYNVFGLHEEMDWLNGIARAPNVIRLSGRTTTDLMRQSTAHGLLNSINHPLLKPWEWRDGRTELRYVHCLEIWNDPTWPDNRRDNPRAIALWTDWLNAGYRTTGIGGSDYHRPVPPPNPPKPADRLGAPSTYVYASELSGRAILEGVRQRRVYVSMGPHATFQARAEDTTYDIGADVGELSGEIEFSATVAHCASPARAQIVKNGRVVAETAVDAARGDASLRWADRMEAGIPAWYRFDVYDPEGMMLAITNPIFAGPPRTPGRQTFGDFVPVNA